VAAPDAVKLGDEAASYRYHIGMSAWTVRRGALERQVADVDTLIRLAHEKRLKSTDLVFHPESHQWMNASDVPEIKQVFAGMSGATTETSLETFEQGQDRPAEEHPPGPSSSTPAAALNHAWGAPSRVLGIIGGCVAIFGGVTLLGLKAAGQNSLIEAIAHGIGIYCIGKGLFMISAIVNFKTAVEFLTQQFRR
jgi:hypothetical protein